MMELNITEPMITVDIGRHRIRIHRSTLVRLGNPAYVRLLVNPDRKGIVVEGCNETTKGAYRLISNHSKEVYSQTLIAEISSCAGFGQRRSVKLAGKQIQGQCAVFFRLDQECDP